MAKISQIVYEIVKDLRTNRWFFVHKIKAAATQLKHGLYTHFVTEILMLLILVAAASSNILDRTSTLGLQPYNQSVLFSMLKKNPEMNLKLVEAYESINMKLADNSSFTKQILAASNKGSVDAKSVPLPTLSGSALLKPNPPGMQTSGIKRDIEVYYVQNGDTVARIASAYGVSVDTVLWENNLTAKSLIRPGQELKILPTTGIKHVVKAGETISGIAKKYAVDAEDVIEYNNIEIEEHIFPGEEIIIPNGIKRAPPTPQRQQYLAELQKEDYRKVDVPADYQGGSSGLVWPLPAATRLSQSYWSRHRAIDVPCRDCTIVAAGAGIVELAGWQKGYGNTIVINHGNGMKTRYAHGKQNLVAAGDNVDQGQAIMISGSTGRSTGPHLHFEVKVNGNLVNPMSYLSR